MLSRMHLNYLREAWPFVIVLLIGTFIFLADFYEVANPFAREVVLLLVSITKSAWFVRFVVRRIQASVEHEFYFHEFILFIGIGILLFILSYAIDYYCLYQIRSDAFRGLPPEPNLLLDFGTFLYFSITNFTTAGLGDILPNITTARIFVAFELIISFFFTILIITNIVTLRESFARKNK